MIQRFVKHVKLYAHFVRMCIVRDMEYRASFFMRITGELLGLVFALVFFGAIYANVQGIAGWTIYETLFLIGTNHIIDSLYSCLFGRNVRSVSEDIRSGSLDSILTKPVNVRFYVSTRYFELSGMSSILAGLPIIIYSLYNLEMGVTPIKVILYFLLLINGVFIKYALSFILVTTSFWLTRAGALYFLFMEFSSLGGYPAEIYKGAAKIAFLYILPIIVIANFPTKVMIRALKPMFIGYAFAVCIVLFLLSRGFWAFAVKRYVSASS